MNELRGIETGILIDMLSAHTALYLKLANEIGKEREYAKCVLTIKAIQTEIDYRKQASANINTSDPNIVIQ